MENLVQILLAVCESNADTMEWTAKRHRDWNKPHSQLDASVLHTRRIIEEVRFRTSLAPQQDTPQ